MDTERTGNPFGEQGLTAAEVGERIAAGKVNVNTELKTKSVRELVVENVCTLFNLINILLAALVIATGAWKNLTFLGVVFLNSAIGVIQSLRSKRMVDKLTLLASKKAVAIRDGAPVELDLDQIVLDDAIRLGRGDQIPADAVVVEGECHVNESLLTGESNPIHKRPGDELMSGSFIDAGLVVARVIHVGADNYVARINNEAKYVKKVNSEIMNALNAIVRFASVFMVPIGLALFYSSAHSSYEAWCALSPESSSTFLGWVLSGQAWGEISAATLSTVGALLGMIPQGLVLLTSSVLAIATIRLARRKVLAQQLYCIETLARVDVLALLGMIPQGLVLLTSSVLAIATIRLARRKVLAQQLYCIETLARVDVLCLDKTGTITSGRMEVAGTYEALADGGVAPAQGAAELDGALAGIARATSADANETCTALLNFYAGAADVPASTRVVAFSSAKKWSGATLAACPAFGGEARSYVMGAAQFVLSAEDFARSTRVVAFSSAKKWSGATLAACPAFGGEARSYVMGAAQFVLSAEDFARYEGSVNELASSCRVLVVARVDGFTDEGDMIGRAAPVGFVTIRDEIRSSAAETIRYFCEQGVTLNVISGDDPRTVSSIACVVGVPGADRFVDATTLDTPAKLDAAVDRYHVFGRVTPQQKRELVVALQRRGHTVAMTGDGVNDVLRRGRGPLSRVRSRDPAAEAGARGGPAAPGPHRRHDR